MGRSSEGLRDEFSIGHYCVGLVDILSQSDALAQWEHCELTDIASPELQSAVKATVGTVHGVRRVATSFIKEFGAAGILPELTSILAPAQVDRLRDFKASTLQLQSFSDTTVWYSQLRASHDLLIPHDVHGMIAGLATIFPMFLGQGTVLRGAVEVGMATDAFDNEVYGPCLARAYHLESKVAKYPRLVVGPVLMNLLADMAKLSGPDIFEQVVREMANEMLHHLIAQDQDGNYIIDYLGTVMKQRAEDAAVDFNGQVRRVYSFVEAEYARFEKMGHEVLGPRYKSLKHYFDSRRHVWFS